MRRTPLLCAAIPVLALGVVSIVSFPKKLIYNASASAPIGFYWLDERPVKRGDYVLTRVPESARDLIEKRDYLPPDVPLIKHIAGVSGDEICREKGAILINGKAVAVAQTHDGLGRPLPIWQGCWVLSGDEVFLLQDHPRSFDGRYFGPIDRQLIIGRATRLRLPWRMREPN